MTALLQNTPSDKQTPSEPTYTYLYVEKEYEALELLFFRLFKQVADESISIAS